MKALLFCTLALAGFLTSKGQVFYIYHVAGDVNVHHGKETRKAVKGDNIGDRDWISLASGARVSILTEDGLAVMIEEKGKYRHDDIAERVRRSDAIATPYFSYVWKKLREHHGHDPATMANRPKGGVSRSEWEIHFPLDSAVIISNDIVFSWRGHADITYFTIRDDTGADVVKTGLQDTLLIVFPFSGGMERGRHYTWHLSNGPYWPASGVSQTFYLADKTWEDAFLTEVKKLKDVLGRLNDEAFEREQIELFYRSQNVYVRPELQEVD